jgi:hypothetical protein
MRERCAKADAVKKQVILATFIRMLCEPGSLRAFCEPGRCFGNTLVEGAPDPMCFVAVTKLLWRWLQCFFTFLVTTSAGALEKAESKSCCGTGVLFCCQGLLLKYLHRLEPPQWSALSCGESASSLLVVSRKIRSVNALLSNTTRAPRHLGIECASSLCILPMAHVEHSFILVLICHQRVSHPSSGWFLLLHSAE